MEYNEELALIQGSLISLEKNCGELKLVKQGDSVVETVIGAIQKIIEKQGISLVNEADPKKIENLRKIHFFLVLNTKLDIQEKLQDDINCGHLVNCAPNLSKELYLELVDKLSLYNYLCETIVEVPIILGSELLDAALDKIKTLDSFQVLPKIELLTNSIYKKYFHLVEWKGKYSKHAQSKLFSYFSSLLQFFIKPDLVGLNSSNTDELYRFAGFALKSVLFILIRCLNIYLNPSEKKIDFHDIYDISLPEFRDEKKKRSTTTISSDDFISELLSACKLNCNSVTVDIWLFWQEIAIDEENADSKSLQRVIAEAMYEICELLKKAQDEMEEFSLANEVISMISCMAAKPRDEDDEINEADVALMVKNITDSSRNQKKWFKALITNYKDIIMSDEKCLNCLDSCFYLVDHEDVQAIVTQAVTHLTASDLNTDDLSINKIKKLVLKMIKHLSLIHQIEILHWYCTDYGLGTVLIKDDFQTEITGVFNKGVETCDNQEQFLSDFVNLCLQSPVDVITKVLHEGLMNSKAISLMVSMLKTAVPVCGIHIVDQEPLIVHLLQKIMKSKLTEVEMSNFKELVVALVNHEIVDGTVFMEMCLLSTLYKDATACNYPLVLLWLQTLHAFLDGTVVVPINIENWALLTLLAQVLELSRWTPSTYSNSSAAVCEEATNIIKKSLKVYIDSKPDEDSELLLLRSKLTTFSTPVNRSYFIKLWRKFDKDWVSSPRDIEILLLELIQNEDNKETEGITTKIFSRGHAYVVYSLGKLLPVCTSTEWKILACKLKEAIKLDGSAQTGRLFINAMLLIQITLMKNFSNMDQYLPCYNHCLRSIGLILKEEVIEHMESTHPEMNLQIWRSTVYLLGKLPQHCVEESTSLLLVSVLIQVLETILSKNSSLIREAVTSFGLVHHHSEALKAFAKWLLDFLAKSEKLLHESNKDSETEKLDQNSQ